MQVVVLAGGKGTRLKPYTTTIPKPLVPIDDMPILEIILRQLKKSGFEDVIIAVNHMARLIEAFFGNGSDLGLNIRYSLEDKKLGTAGPLGLIDGLDENFLVLNGDLLTTLNYKDIFTSHVDNHADITIGTFEKEVKIDLGILETTDGKFSNYIEKPIYKFVVSMGVYGINKSVLDFMQPNEYLDFPDLVLKLKSNEKKIHCYSGEYDWLDIGRPKDYERAIEIFRNNKSDYL